MTREYLLVDGYNIIHAWPELQEASRTSLETARVRLIELLQDYAGYSGRKVWLVFDAYSSSRKARAQESYPGLEVFYTRENETADHFIERAVGQLVDNYTRVYVATSDFTEQSVAFGGGAVRMSARELKNELNSSRNLRNNVIASIRPLKPHSLESRLSEDVLNTLKKLGGK